MIAMRIRFKQIKRWRKMLSREGIVGQKQDKLIRQFEVEEVQYQKRIKQHETAVERIANRLWPKCNCKARIKDVKHGYALVEERIVVIPLSVMDRAWGMDKLPGYRIWYIAHELAHIKSPPRHGKRKRDIHGIHFIEALKSLCPRRYLKYEKDYKK